MTPLDGIDPALWKITFDELNNAVDVGFGTVQFGEADFDFIQELKLNNGVFSAFKNHEQTKDLIRLLRDEKGNLKSFSQFRKDTESIIGDYNKRWLKTEYNTAIQKARTASNWKKWEKVKHLYPNIEYLPSRAAVQRAEHKVFYGIVLPMNNPFWATHTPPIDWGCMCGSTNTDKESTEIPENNVKVAPGLDNNPALSKRLFSKSHPYENKLSKKAHKTVSRSTEKLLRNSMRIWAKKMLVGNNTLIVKKELKYPISFTNQQIKVITGKAHPERSYRDMLLMNIEDVMQQAELINTTAVIDSEVNHKFWYYYKVKLQGKETYINVFEDTRNGVARIHAVSSFKPI